MLAFIYWDVSPEIVDLGFIALRWYGILFALAFLAAHNILTRVYRIEKCPLQDLESFTIYVIIATIAGARLGHCLFYEPEKFLPHPLEIFKIWEGGLASHGAAIGILFGVYYYSRKNPRYNYLWLLDRIVITIALAGCFIRIGNLMNSEIIGKPSTVSWAFIFKNVDNFPRHPAQLYESITCLILFLVLLAFYNKKRERTTEGSLFGIFMTVVFTLRFLFEFLKENQVEFESSLSLNMGQILSIPLVFIGLATLLNAYKIINFRLNKYL
jgi:phosphatidylglycerol---prolipoprotein diacylglyceryl transferase